MSQATRTVSRWRFFRLCWADALHGAWGVFGAVSAVASLLIPAGVAYATRIPKEQRGPMTAFFANPAVPDLVWFAPLVVFLAVLAYRLFIVAPYNIYRDNPTATTETLDVRLEGTFPGTFALHASGHACEIRTGPILQESGIVGTEQYGDQTINHVTQRYILEFPVVSALRNGSKEIEPSLFCEDPDRHGRSGWPTAGSVPQLKEFFRNAMLVRNSEGGTPDLKTLSVGEIDALIKRQRQPMHFTLAITFWDGECTQQWKRSELLVYEPETNTAFVRHSGVPTLTSHAR